MKFSVAAAAVLLLLLPNGGGAELNYEHFHEISTLTVPLEGKSIIEKHDELTFDTQHDARIRFDSGWVGSVDKIVL